MPVLSGGQVTRLWPYGGPGGQYGDFSGKSAAPPGSKSYTATFTQHSPGGSPQRLYGSFAGKAAAVTFEFGSGTIGLTGSTGSTAGNFTYNVNWDFEPPLQITGLVGSLGITGVFQYNSVGTLAVTLATATLAATGTVTVDGELATTLVDDTLAAEGAQEGVIEGTLETTLSDDTSEIQASPDITGTLVVTLQSDTMNSTGMPVVVGTLSCLVTNDFSSAYGLVGDPPTGSASKLPVMGVGA
jgi:hypothetical protein